MYESSNVCEHFIGDLWDSDVRLEKNDELIEAKGVELIQEIEGLGKIDLFDSWFEKQSEKIKNILQQAIHEERFRIEEDERIIQGEDIETDGMLGGYGYNLYCEDPKIVEVISGEIGELIELVKAWKKNNLSYLRISY